MDLEEKFESLPLAPSKVLERYIVKTGYELHLALVDASRVDEIEFLADAIGEYTLLCSVYGDKTDRVPESLGVDLNEAVYFKIKLTPDDKDTELYDKFIGQFASTLDQVALRLFGKPSSDL